jgi:hypothetical protein
VPNNSFISKLSSAIIIIIIYYFFAINIGNFFDRLLGL